MDNNGTDDIKISRNDAAATTIEIKIKTMFCDQTLTLRIDKCVPVPALKEQIAVVTGVLSDHQRLICRGRVLKDDQLLSDYHVEDGDTLHLIVRQPSQDGISGPQETAPGSSSGHSQGNLSEQEAQDIPIISQIVSAVIGHLGNVNLQSGNEEPQPSESGAVIRMSHLGNIDMHSGFVPSDLNIDITIRTGGQLFPENVNFQDMNTNSAAEDTVASENAAPQDTMPPVEDEGVFLSNLLRQIMPFISESSGTTPTIPPTEETNAAEDLDGSAQVQENIEQATSSDAQFDQPESKHQKQE